MRATGEICTTKGSRERNEDYALLDVQYGACIADGVGGAPLGDALARLACHTAMNAMRQGLSATEAGRKASAAVGTFIEQVDSPTSGTGLMVVRLELPYVELAWYGDLAYFLCRGSGNNGSARTNLNDGACLVREALNITGGCERFETVKVERGDMLIACTDGVWRDTPLERVDIIAREARDVRDVAGGLVFERKARDNATALALTFE